MKKFIAGLILIIGIGILTLVCSDDEPKMTILPLPGGVVGCDVVEIENGYEVTCGDSTFEIYHGEQTDLEIIDPCGDDPNHFDEVLIKVGNQIFAFFRDSNDTYEFITIVPPGYYVTTDQQACYFTITENLEVIWDE